MAVRPWIGDEFNRVGAFGEPELPNLAELLISFETLPPLLTVGANAGKSASVKLVAGWSHEALSTNEGPPNLIKSSSSAAFESC